MSYTVKGVFAADSVTRDGRRLPLEALVAFLQDSWNRPRPSLVGHDAHRPIGWTWPIGIHLEPNLARLLGMGTLAETQEERTKLAEAYRSEMIESVLLRVSDSLPQLESLLGPHLNGNEKVHDLGCTALIGDQLATRVFPRLFADVDGDGLVALGDLDAIFPGVYRIGELLVFADSYFRRSLSRPNFLNAELLRELERLVGDDGVRVRIRLDPDAVGLATTALEPFEFEYCHGPKFRNDLSNIAPGVTRHEAEQLHSLFDGVSRTEFWWQSRLNKDKAQREHILEIEELRDHETFGDRNNLSWGCRYVHSIVNEITGRIEHLDGAVREYDDSEFVLRLDTNIGRAGRHTKYTKLWRVDGSLPFSTWKTLIYYHFRNNSLVGEYFDGQSHASESMVQSAATKSPIVPLGSSSISQAVARTFVPYSMSAGQGVRAIVTFHRSPSTRRPAGCTVIPDREWVRDGAKQAAVDATTIDLVKLAKSRHVAIEIPPHTALIAYEDLYTQFPLIRHVQKDTLVRCLEVFRELISVWADRDDNRIVTFTNGMLLDDREVWLSVMGHVKDVSSWFAQKKPFPPSDTAGLTDWMREARAYLDSCIVDPDIPSLVDVVSPYGLFDIDRKQIDRDAYKLDRDAKSGRPVVHLRLDAENPAAQLCASGVITFAPVFVIKSSECSSCGAEYRDCDCCKYLVSDVTEAVRDCSFLGLFWTDRPSARVEA
jgi:hypothetical protein